MIAIDNLLHYLSKFEHNSIKLLILYRIFLELLLQLVFFFLESLLLGRELAL